MEPNLLKCCIPPCLLSPLNRSRCPCRLKKFRNRVGPAKPVIFTVSKQMSPSAENDPVPVPPHSKFNGQTNLYFNEDESADCEAKFNGNGKVDIIRDDIDSKDFGNPQDTVDSTKFGSSEIEDRISVGEELESNLSKTFNQFLSEVYIQLSKSKQLRVVHIKSNEVDGSLSVQRSTEGVNGLGTSVSSSDDDEEDDYWFSKWSRRPKLKNTFKVQVKSKKAKREAMLEINNRTTLHFEQYEEKDEDKEETKVFRDAINRRLQEAESVRRSRSPSLFESPPPHSPKDPSPIRGEETCESRRNSFDCIPVKLSYDTEEWPGRDEMFRQDLDPNGEPLPPPAAFTNFGFQFDPEDSGRSGDAQENHKTETAGDLLTSDNPNPVLNVVSPLFNFSEPEPEQIKTNGCIRTNISPIRTEIEAGLTNGHALGVDQPESLGSSVTVTDHFAKPLLFFIHGISGSSDVWKGQFKFFHELGYEIVAPDLLGHGLSSTPNKAKHYLFESLVQDLVAVFNHFVSEGRRSVIIGHGYGACMGTVLSRICSQNVSLLISVSGGGPTPLIPFGCLERPLLPIPLRFRKKKSIGRFDNPELRRVLPESIHQHILNGQLWVDGDAAFHRRIALPTLLVYGMRDPVVTLVEECEMERTIPKAFLELIPSAGHMVMWDDPINFNRMLISFIEGWADSHP